MFGTRSGLLREDSLQFPEHVITERSASWLEGHGLVLHARVIEVPGDVAAVVLRVHAGLR